MKNSKYILRFALVCAIIGIAFMGAGWLAGGETQVNIKNDWVDFSITPWGIHSVSDFDDDDNIDNMEGNGMTENFEKFSKIDVSLAVENVSVSYGDKYEIEIIGDARNVVKYAIEGDTLVVSHKMTIMVFPRKIDVNITIPTGVKLESCNVASVSGGVKIEVEADKIDGKATSGSVKLDCNGGEAYAHSVSGKVEVNGKFDSLRAKTTSGKIEIDTAAKAIEAQSVSGKIYMTLEGKRDDYAFDCSSVSGKINIGDDKFSNKAALGSNGIKVEAKTTSGGIEIDFD